MEPITPRQAAAVLLLRPERAEVLMVRRNPSLAFMGGHHAFPGGRIDPEDAPDYVEGTADVELARRIFAAAREVFEETGLLLARGEFDRDYLRAARRALHNGAMSFADILDAVKCIGADRCGVRLDAGAFVPAGVWVTPPFSPIRYETQYFMYRYEGPLWEEVVEPDGEIVELAWLQPEMARAQWHRGELRLSTPVAFVLRHLGALPPEEAAPWLCQTPRYDILEDSYFEVQCGIGLIPLPTETLPPATHTNCTIIGDRELFVIDPGARTREAQAPLLALLDRFVALDARVRAVLLTHGHPDHAGAAETLRDRYGAAIWGHTALPGIALDRRLADGEAIEVAGDPPWRIRCLHTPGHCPEHLCFLEESVGAMICGDMIANPGTIIIDPEHGGDMTQYLESLERLLAYSFVYTVPGHGMPSFHDDGKGLIRHSIAHRLEREAKILAAIQAGATTIQAVLERAYADTAKEIWPLAERQLRAHLLRLGYAKDWGSGNEE